MGRRFAVSKLKKEDRRFLRKAGFRREHGAVCELACAIKEAHETKREEGYVVQPDSSWGERTRRRVRRERRMEIVRALRHMAVFAAIYAGSAAVVVLIAGLIWFFSV